MQSNVKLLTPAVTVDICAENFDEFPPNWDCLHTVRSAKVLSGCPLTEVA